MSGRGKLSVPWASNPEKRFRLSPSAPRFLRCGLLVGHRIACPINGVRFSALAPFFSCAGVAQVEEHRIRNAEVGVSNTPSGSKPM